MDYIIKRQKNNESARLSRLKRKECEMDTARKKQTLEKTYVKLHKEISRIVHSVRV